MSDFDPDYDGYDGDRQIDMVCIGCRVRLTFEHQLAWCDQADGPVCSMCDDSRRGLLVVHSMTARPGEDAVTLDLSGNKRTTDLGRWPGGDS